MDYGDAVAWLFSLHKFGMKLGLENIRVLLQDLGRPQDSYPCVLVAGTNGKGSTAAMLHAVLLAGGRRSGLYTSPHLVHTEERIRIGDDDIDGGELAAILTEIRTAIDRLLAGGTLAATPTFFEVITAAALVAFSRARVEIAVLEVGLGGRLDATNVVDPVLSVITTIEKDHQEQLGGTLDAIAREKAGILRPGVPAILGPLSPEPLAAIREVASRLGSPLVLASEGSRVAVDERDPGTAPGREGQARSAPGRPTRLFSVSTPVADYPSLACPLSGNHQRNNALIAIRAAEVLAERLTLGLDTQAVREGIATTRWPGRLEWVAGAPALLLDGAHNPAGCRALADYLVASGLRPVLLFAAMHDKEIEPMLASLLPHVSACVFTAPPSPRAADPDALVDLARKVYRGLGPPTGAAMEMSPIHHPVELLLVADGGRFLAERDVAGALGRARRLAGARGTVLAAGSLFLVGAVKEVLLGLPVRAGEGA